MRKEDVKIVIRSQYFRTFSVGFSSFLKFNLEWLENLTIQSNCSLEVEKEEHDKFMAMTKKFNLNLVNQSPDNFADRAKEYGYEDNFYSLLLRESLLKKPNEIVISLDDDVIFTKKGFFQKVLDIQNSTKNMLLGFKMNDKNSNGPFTVMNSACIVYSGRDEIPKRWFPSSLEESGKNWNGVDTGLLSEVAQYDITYIDDFFEGHTSSATFFKNDFLIHVGGATCGWWKNEETR